MIDINKASRDQLLELRAKIDEKLKSNDKCIYCGNKADYLCDLVIGADVNKSYDAFEFFTCDAPLCERHKLSINPGRIFMCNTDIQNPSCESWVQINDYCCSHEKLKDNYLPITEQLAERIREKHYERARGTRVI